MNPPERAQMGAPTRRLARDDDPAEADKKSAKAASTKPRHKTFPGLLIATYVVFAAATVSPLFLISVVPLVDYPNQLAHMWVLLHGHDIPELANNYIVHWRLLPYLAMDLIVPELSKVMPIEVAGRIFVGLTMLSLLLGTVALQRALHGRVGWWPLVSLLFIYNAVLFWGFMDCLFGMGMFLFVFAGWVATERWRLIPRLVLFALAASMLLIFHLFAFGLYGLAVASYEFAIFLQSRDDPLRRFASYAVRGLQFVPGLVLWWLSLANGGSTYTNYGDFLSKLYAFVGPTTFGFPPVKFDILLWLFAVVFLVFGLLAGWLHLAPRMRWPIGIMLIAAILMPNWLSGSWAADIRLPVILPFLAVGSIRFDSSSRRMALHVFAAMALVLFVLRLWGVAAAWLDADKRIAEFRHDDVAMRLGSRILTVLSPRADHIEKLPGAPAFLAARQPFALAHLQALAVIDRSAFIPDMFYSWITVDPAPRNRLVYEDNVAVITPAELAETADEESGRDLKVVPNKWGDLPYWRDWPKTFDYVLWFDDGYAPTKVPRPLVPVATGSFFVLYRVEHP